jgi:glycosyltransferase involved in cell wall biosynthesis
MAVLLQPHWQAPVLIHEHNVESQIAQRFYEKATHPLLKLFLYAQYRRMERFEHALWRKHPQVVAVSEQDRAIILQYTPDQNVTVVENGVDLDYFSYQPHPGISPNLVYIGSMDWLPNEDAVLWFVKEIFPILRSQWPDCTFTIVGRNPSEQVRRLANEPGIVVTGTVKEVRTFIAAASIMVVPLRIGGGSRLKILEAMSAGLPVVSTPIGCEGLRVADEVHLLIAEEPHHFAAQTSRLIADLLLQQKLAEAGRRLVEEHYGWPAMAHRLSQLYHSMTKANNS